jgi:hypothetical protein
VKGLKGRGKHARKWGLIEADAFIEEKGKSYYAAAESGKRKKWMT